LDRIDEGFAAARLSPVIEARGRPGTLFAMVRVTRAMATVKTRPRSPVPQPDGYAAVRGHRFRDERLFTDDPD